ncbi:MAG: D-alanyl-D-alanine carboxypeptidase/D-alanyl-D-alanine endopeptidase [Nocardioides sp.]
MLLVVVLLGGAVAAYHWSWGDRFFGTTPDEPAAVPPPQGLRIPALSAPKPVARPATSGRLHPAAVRRALAPGLSDRHLGRRTGVVVAPLSGPPVLARDTRLLRPASTTKLLTTTAALSVLGPDHTFDTRVVAAGHGRIVLVGGGDPLLAGKPNPDAPGGADLVTLARRTAKALGGAKGKVRVGYDDTLFTGAAVNPRWPDDYVPADVVTPISALWVDEGRVGDGPGRVGDPSLAAAQEFAADLRRFGVSVAGAPRAREAPCPAHALATVTSRPLSDIVEHTIAFSDNEAAEVLARQVGLATSGRGSFAGGTSAVRRALGQLGVDLGPAKLYDGSGLSRDDRINPRSLVRMLQLAAAPDHPELRSVLTGLPVAGFTGSLVDRFEQHPNGSGWVRAKTGTLAGVSALAGVATDRDGTPIVFAFVSDRIALADTLDARAALDGLAAALADCRC